MTSDAVLTPKKREADDIPDLSPLPQGQRTAVEALIGGGTQARTYLEAAELAGMSLGTVKTHLRRVRQRHPQLYKAIRRVRRSQLAVRHRLAVMNAQGHSRAYFRRVNRFLYQQLGYRFL